MAEPDGGGSTAPETVQLREQHERAIRYIREKTNELLKVIRATETLAKTPVIVLTADLYVAESLEDLADYVIIKSYGVSRLRELVAKLASADTSAIGNAQAT